MTARTISFRRHARTAMAASAIFASSLLAPDLMAKTDAYVSRQYLSHSEGQKKLQDEVKLSGGKVTSITLVVQTLDFSGNKSAYLIAKVPQKAIDRINSDISGKSSSETANYLTGWVVAKKQLLAKYYYAKGKSSSFSADLDSTAPPKPRTISTSGLAHVVRGPKVDAAVSSGKLPKQVLKGSGTKQDPFVVKPNNGKPVGVRGAGSTIMRFAAASEVEGFGLVYFTVELTGTQLSKKHMGDVAEELKKIYRGVFEYMRKNKYNDTYPKGFTDSVNTVVRGVTRSLNEFRRKASAADSEMKQYFRTN